jgi:hypothetical protein
MKIPVALSIYTKSYVSRHIWVLILVRKKSTLKYTKVLIIRNGGGSVYWVCSWLGVGVSIYWHNYSFVQYHKTHIYNCYVLHLFPRSSSDFSTFPNIMFSCGFMHVHGVTIMSLNLYKLGSITHEQLTTCKIHSSNNQNVEVGSSSVLTHKQGLKIKGHASTRPGGWARVTLLMWSMQKQNTHFISFSSLGRSMASDQLLAAAS